MNRAQRRQEARAARRGLRHLRDAGCNCSPRYFPISTEGLPAGAKDGLYVVHEMGCPFGDAMIPANRAGRVPSVFYFDPGDGRCTR